MPSCKLHSLNPRHESLTVTLGTDDAFRFGRRADCEQSFPADYRISGVHASLAVVGSQFAIEDHSSVNGTFVNRERLHAGTPRVLSNGDSFYLVIPSKDLLQAGYTGSLTASFVGYLFELSDLPPAPADGGGDGAEPSSSGSHPPVRPSFAAWWLSNNMGEAGGDPQWSQEDWQPLSSLSVYVPSVAPSPAMVMVDGTPREYRALYDA